jgi:hypothetical protein
VIHLPIWQNPTSTVIDRLQALLRADVLNYTRKVVAVTMARTEGILKLQ